jgi:GxxExxY protein
MDTNAITDRIIGAAIDVYRALGPGLLESAYEACLAYEIRQRGLECRRQVRIPIKYKGVKLDCGYRLDMVVNSAVIVEVKAIEKFDAIHTAQVITYLKLMQCQVGLLLNFNVGRLTQGIRRIINS